MLVRKSDLKVGDRVIYAGFIDAIVLDMVDEFSDSLVIEILNDDGIAIIEVYFYELELDI